MTMRNSTALSGLPREKQAAGVNDRESIVLAVRQWKFSKLDLRMNVWGFANEYTANILSQL